MEWLQFVMHLESLPADTVESVFTRHGAEAITLSDAADDPVLEPAPGETPLWDRVIISGLFPPTANLSALQQDLMSSLELGVLPTFHTEVLRDRAWEREWLKDFRPMCFGRKLWVVPGEQPVPATEAIIVKLDPGLAFGTGTHPTTALCLEWLDGLDLQNKRVLDFGCGSGILGIAALLLGAGSTVAVDIDSQALLSTRDNAERNQVGERLSTGERAESPAGAFDIVLANILAEPLKANAALLCGRLVEGGALALSGILEHQSSDVAAAYRPYIDFDEPATSGAWVRLTGTRNAHAA